MNSKLSLKQRKFWKKYLECHSLTESAKHVGSKGKDTFSLSVIGYQILKSIKNTFPEILEAEGLGTQQIIETMKAQLKATKPVVATWEGRITDERLYPDNAAIGKALEHLGRMHGVFIDRQELTGRDGGDIMLQVAPMRSKRDTKQIDMDVD